jgi:hypothetical protein
MEPLKTHITCERYTTNAKDVLNSDRKPWSTNQLVTSFPVCHVIQRLSQQNTNRKSGFSFRKRIFFALGVASKAAESQFRETLKNGKISAKHVNRSLIGSRGRASDMKMFSPLGGASTAVESQFTANNSRTVRVMTKHVNRTTR